MNKNFLLLLLACVVGYFATTGSGCENTTNNPVVITDTNVLVFDGRILTERFTDADSCAINLLTGQVVTGANITKDIQLGDSNGTSANFFLRSGDKLDNSIPGFETDFKMFREYDNITKAQFDTISKIKNVGTSSGIDPTNYDVARTDNYGDVSTALKYFNTGTPFNQRVYSFYLREKYNSGITTVRTFGILHVESLTIGTDGKKKLKINVRINKAGDNQFLRQYTTTTTN